MIGDGRNVFAGRLRERRDGSGELTKHRENEHSIEHIYKQDEYRCQHGKPNPEIWADGLNEIDQRR